MNHFTLRVTGPHFGNVFNITYSDVSYSLCDTLTNYINEIFDNVNVNFKSSLYQDGVKIPQGCVHIGLKKDEIPQVLRSMDKQEILLFLVNFENAVRISLYNSNYSICKDTVVAEPVFIKDRTNWDNCIDCSESLHGAQLCHHCLKNAKQEHQALSCSENIVANVLQDILRQVCLMTRKNIIDLHQKSLLNLIKTLRGARPKKNERNELWFNNTWESICSEFGDFITIFNSLQQEWVELKNEDGDELTAFDTESIDPSAKVTLIVKLVPVQEAKERLLPLELESAIYTFSCFAEGHVGHEIELSESARKKENKALEKEDLEAIEKEFKREGAVTKMYCLKTHEEEPDAFVLHIRDKFEAVPYSENITEQAYDELKSLGKGGVDTTFFCTRRKKELNKLARYNCNVGDRSQDPDIANGKNTLYSFDEMPWAKRIRNSFDHLAKKLNLPQMKGLLAEANLYYNSTCGIRYHGDEERPESPVIGVNFGNTRYLDFRSFYKHAMFGPQHRIELNHGDIYFMSRHAVGIGWCKDTYRRVIFRHRAGSLRFLMKHDKELEARARRKLEKRAKKKRKLEAQQEVGRIAGIYNDPSLLCHACNKYQRELRNIVWYDTGGDGTQYCLKCNAEK